jgi:glutathione S-transferase
MAVKLHRCSVMWVKGGHPCWKVQKALEESGVEYELVKAPAFPRGRRKEVQRVTGQTKLPAIEFENGNAYRDESAQMVEEIRAGKLFEHAG